MSAILWPRRTAQVAAVGFGVLTLGIGLASVPIDGLLHQTGPGGPVIDWLVTAVPMVSAAAVGTLVAARRPGNPIGWMLLAIFLFAAAPAAEYARLDYRVHHGTLPFGGAAVVLGEAWPVFLVLIVVLLWLFPDGRLPPGRWRGVARVLVVAGVLAGLAASARGVAAVAGHDIRIDAGGNLTADQNGPWKIPMAVVIAGSLAGGLTWLVVQAPRYRRSAGERRQQLKWLYTGAIVFVISVFLPGQVDNYLIGPLGAAALPVCIGVAVLKYRLFEIDRIISRVISYAIVTAVLAGVFAGLVLLTTAALPFRTTVGVAVATLAAAALFNPLRKRVQHAVDRRFNRARYNADLTVAAFASRLKDGVDLDSVQEDLATVVQKTLEPAHVSVWMTNTAKLAEPRLVELRYIAFAHRA